MLTRDLIRLTTGAIIAHRMRSVLTGLGIAVGIAAVVLLTAIGEGVQRFVLQEFTQFGTNLLAIVPEFGLRVFQEPAGADLAGAFERSGDSLD